jgi:hypothetical protein
VSFSVISQAAHMLLPGKLPLEFHLCNGSDPDEVSRVARKNVPLLAVFAVTLVVNTFVPIRIRQLLF